MVLRHLLTISLVASLTMLLSSSCREQPRTTLTITNPPQVFPAPQSSQEKQEDPQVPQPSSSPSAPIDSDSARLMLQDDATNRMTHVHGRSLSGGGSYIPLMSGGGGGGDSRPSRADEIENAQMHMYVHWHHMAIDASGIDHNAPSPTLSTKAVREQMGPGRSSRAMAIVHIAIFEAVNAIKGNFESYIGLDRADAGASVEAAIAIAAYETLKSLYPSQEPSFLYQFTLDMQRIIDGDAKDRGLDVGLAAAEKILAMRAHDGSNHLEPIVDVNYFPNLYPGHWRKDPISNIPIALGAYWYNVTPFIIDTPEQFRAPPPPSLTSEEYTAAYNEAKSLGGDGIHTPTDRTEEQTEIGIFWAYDGVPNLCAPPRLFNQVALVIAQQEGTKMLELARLFAILNVALADTTSAVWESKYYYDIWRPVTAIREADPGTGPSLLGDGNPDTVGDVNFYPLGAPATNLADGVDFTPPFPAYPSGHAGMGGAAFQILRHYYGTDEIAFTFISDELNGETIDSDGNVRPLRPRHFENFSQAEEENGQSRIYLGIHWVFDKTGGITQGNAVADYVWDRIYRDSSSTQKAN